MSILGNQKLRAGDSWAQLSTRCTRSTLSGLAFAKCYSNQERVIKICTNMPGSWRTRVLQGARRAKVCLLCVFSYKTKNNKNDSRSCRSSSSSSSGASNNNKNSICIKQQTAPRFRKERLSVGVGLVGALKRKLMSVGVGWQKEGNPKIQSPRRRRNHFINASFVREHGRVHSRYMARTWPYASEYGPKASAPAKNGSCLHAEHETLRETCHQAGTTCDSCLQKLIIFYTQCILGRSGFGGACSQLLVH